jgi:redox-sensitive bicupin YhaK (pirin superfamily)
MELQLRRARERAQYDRGWLETAHTFSFADYYDARHMGFRVLRGINEDVVAPGRGFGMHPHRDMEIVTYVLDGELGHRDSMGNGSVIRPGDVQRMSAGTGVTHSETNPSSTQNVHLLQIWILPDRHGYPPSYEQKAFSAAERQGTLRVVASPDGRDGSVTIHQDTTIAASLLSAGQQVDYALAKDRYAWVQVARSSIELEGHELAAGDGAALRGPGTLPIRALDAAELLLFDLP